MPENINIFVLLGIALVGVAFLAIISIRKSNKGIDKKKFLEDWTKIEKSLSDDQTSMQMAILNADKILDRALRGRGFKGKTVGERMTSASRDFTKRDAVWLSHKLRNKIAHEENVKLNLALTKKALASFKRALRDLGAL